MARGLSVPVCFSPMLLFIPSAMPEVSAQEVKGGVTVGTQDTRTWGELAAIRPGLAVIDTGDRTVSIPFNGGTIIQVRGNADADVLAVGSLVGVSGNLAPGKPFAVTDARVTLFLRRPSDSEQGGKAAAASNSVSFVGRLVSTEPFSVRAILGTRSGFPKFDAAGRVVGQVHWGGKVIQVYPAGDELREVRVAFPADMRLAEPGDRITAYVANGNKLGVARILTVFKKAQITTEQISEKEQAKAKSRKKNKP